MPNWRIWSGVLAAGCTVLVVLRLQPTPSPSVPQNTKPVQVAALLEKQGGNTVVKPNATATKKPTTQKPTETIHVQPAFEKTVTPAPKKSTPMIARRTPNRLEVARTDAGKEHSLKFALDGEMPIEQTQTRYVMGSVPSQEYTISPASYEEKDSKAW